jgi:hypothetical protein
MAEALRLGWQVFGDAEEPSDDLTNRTGNVEMFKDLGNKTLSLDIPFRARFAYGKPKNPQAHKAERENAR